MTRLRDALSRSRAAPVRPPARAGSAGGSSLTAGDWKTLAGSGTTSITQTASEWLDLAPFGDVVFWLEVRAVANPGAGNVTLAYETSPRRDPNLFQPLATITLAASSSPVITPIRLADDPAVPLARWVRWTLQGTASGDWSVTFRVFVTAGKSPAAAFTPASLSLTGWWRASYAGSPWTGAASAGSSGSTSLSEATNPPSVGSAVNGYTPADFDGTNDILATGGNVSDLVSDAAGSIIVLAYIDSAFTDTGSTSYYDAPAFLTDSASSGNLSFCFSTSGVRLGSYNGSTWDSVAAAASTSAWHLLQGRWDSSTIEVRADSGSWATLSRTVSMGTNAAVVGQNYTGANFLDGRVLELITSQSRLTDSEFESLRRYANSRYALAL